MQDIVAYGLVAVIFIAFVYFAVASRKGGDRDREKDGKQK